MAIVKFDSGIKQIRGKSGGVNFAKTKYGIEYKTNPTFDESPSAGQLAQQSRMKKSGAAFNSLTAAQNAAWQTYAQAHPRRAKSGAEVPISAYAAFSGLYTKFIQVNPGGTFPTAPPATPFAGDTVLVTAAGASGKITFTASKANAANVTTELLLQPLKNVYRKPTVNYTSAGFFTFVTGTLSTQLTVPAGAYSVAIRFVNSATGQDVDKVVLGTVNAA